MAEDQQEYTRVTILRSSNARKLQLEVSLAHTTLADIKNHIANNFQFLVDSNQSALQSIETTSGRSSSIPKLNHQQQRIFHLGRELKSGGRTLEKLGLGRFPINTILHLHVVNPLPQRKLQQHVGYSMVDEIVVIPSLLPPPWPAMPDIPTFTSLASDTLGLLPNPDSNVNNNQRSNTTTSKQVIDLLEDDEDDFAYLNESDHDDPEALLERSLTRKSKRRRV